MKLATIRDDRHTVAVRIDGDEAVELGASDVRDVLRRNDWTSWAAQAPGPRHLVEDLAYAPLVGNPDRSSASG